MDAQDQYCYFEALGEINDNLEKIIELLEKLTNLNERKDV
jgi:hypothetical protein